MKEQVASADAELAKLRKGQGKKRTKQSTEKKEAPQDNGNADFARKTTIAREPSMSFSKQRTRIVKDATQSGNASM